MVRESGGDFSAVTGGTRVLSDWLVVRIAVNPGESFLDRMIGMVEGATRQKTPNEVALTILLVVLTIVFVRLLGLEFLPKLEEGNLWIRATLPPTISLQEGNAYVNEMRKMIRARPEVESVVSQHGRPDDGTDAAAGSDTDDEVSSTMSADGNGNGDGDGDGVSDDAAADEETELEPAGG